MSRPTRDRKPAKVYGNFTSSDQPYGSDDENMEDDFGVDEDEDSEHGSAAGGGGTDNEEGEEVDDEDNEDEDEGESKRMASKKETSKSGKNSSSTSSRSTAKPTSTSTTSSSKGKTSFKGKPGKTASVKREIKKIELKRVPANKGKVNKVVEPEDEDHQEDSTEIEEKKQELDEEEGNDHDDDDGSEINESESEMEEEESKKAKKLTKNETIKSTPAAKAKVGKKAVSKVKKVSTPEPAEEGSDNEDHIEEDSPTDTEDAPKAKNSNTSVVNKATTAKKDKTPLLKTATTASTVKPVAISKPLLSKNKIHLLSSSGTSATSGVKPTISKTGVVGKKFAGLLPKTPSAAPSSSSSFDAPTASATVRPKPIGGKKPIDAKKGKAEEKPPAIEEQKTKLPAKKLPKKEIEKKKAEAEEKEENAKGEAYEEMESEVEARKSDNEESAIDKNDEDEVSSALPRIGSNSSSTKTNKRVRGSSDKSSKSPVDKQDGIKRAESKAAGSTAAKPGRGSKVQASSPEKKRKTSKTDKYKEISTDSELDNDASDGEIDAEGVSVKSPVSEVGSSSEPASPKLSKNRSTKKEDDTVNAKKSKHSSKTEMSKTACPEEDSEEDRNMESDTESLEQPFNVSNEGKKKEPVNVTLGSYPTPVTPPKRKVSSTPSTPCPSPKRSSPSTKISAETRSSIISALYTPEYIKTVTWAEIETSTQKAKVLSRHWKEVLGPELSKHFAGNPTKKGKITVDKKMRLKIWELVCKKYDKLDWESIEGEGEISITKLKRHFREVMIKEGKKYIESC